MVVARLSHHDAVHVAGEPAEAVPDGLHLRARGVGHLRDRGQPLPRVLALGVRRRSATCCATSACRCCRWCSAWCSASWSNPTTAAPGALGRRPHDLRRRIASRWGCWLAAAAHRGRLTRASCASTRARDGGGGGMSTTTGVSASEQLAAWLATTRRRAAAAARSQPWRSGCSWTSSGCAWRRGARTTSRPRWRPWTAAARAPRSVTPAASTPSARRSSTARRRTARITTTRSRAGPCTAGAVVVPAVLAACEREGLGGDRALVGIADRRGADVPAEPGGADGRAQGRAFTRRRSSARSPRPAASVSRSAAAGGARRRRSASPAAWRRASSSTSPRARGPSGCTPAGRRSRAFARR